jgi:flagellar protein FlaJ
MEIIPFLPLPIPVMQNLAAPFRGLGGKIMQLTPKLRVDLYQARIDISHDDYAAIMVLCFVFYFLFFWVISFFVLAKLNASFVLLFGIKIPAAFFLCFVVGIVFGFLVFAQLVAFPKIKIKQRVREIDSQLVFALRNMLVQIKSGVSLFSSLCMIAYSKRYGKLGDDIKVTVDRINSGYSEEEALKELGEQNPSQYLRKVIWQIVNGMRAGSDVSDILSESVSTITREQQIEIEKYGNNLKILSLMYLMIGVIIPALGLTFLIVVGSFPRIQITETVFWGMLGMIIVSEFMFIGIIKSKRPSLMSA